MTRDPNNWLKHAGAALAIQIALGGAVAFFLPWFLYVTGALAVGFFIGIEWMQELRVQNPDWPNTPTTFEAALRAFTGWDSDRYGDIGFGMLACSLVAAGWMKLHAVGWVGLHKLMLM